MSAAERLLMVDKLLNKSRAEIGEDRKSAKTARVFPEWYTQPTPSRASGAGFDGQVSAKPGLRELSSRYGDRTIARRRDTRGAGPRTRARADRGNRATVCEIIGVEVSRAMVHDRRITATDWALL